MSERDNRAVLGWHKRLLFGFVVAALGWFFLETTVWLVYLMRNHDALPRADFRSDIVAVSRSPGSVVSGANSSDKENRFKKHMLHPYIGSRAWGRYRFLTADGHPFRRQKNRLLIGIFGGSFAGGTQAKGRDVIVSRLAAATGKEVQLVSLAIGGGKQPQQLMALTYLLALGGEFDVVINIDGFNEVALPPHNNIPKGVFPAYPRDWYFRATELQDPKIESQLETLKQLAHRRQWWASAFSRGPLCYSNLGLTLWHAGDSLLQKQEIKLNCTLRESPPLDTRPEVTGPAVKFENDTALYGFLSRLWMQSSLQMHVLAEGNGMLYFHFLQPNQYVPNSKPMSTEERKIAIRPRSPRRKPVVMGYPMLREHGQTLKEAGVRFHDLTMVFDDHEEILYKDTCCHANETGYEIVANRIVDALLDNGFVPKQQNTGRAG